jgi:plasmid stability protein
VLRRHNFFLDIELVDRLRVRARKEGVSMADILRRALAAYLTA